MIITMKEDSNSDISKEKMWHSTLEQHTPKTSHIDCDGLEPYQCQTSHRQYIYIKMEHKLNSSNHLEKDNNSSWLLIRLFSSPVWQVLSVSFDISNMFSTRHFISCGQIIQRNIITHNVMKSSKYRKQFLLKVISLFFIIMINVIFKHLNELPMLMVILHWVELLLFLYIEK